MLIFMDTKVWCEFYNNVQYIIVINIGNDNLNLKLEETQYLKICVSSSRNNCYHEESIPIVKEYVCL